MDKQALLVNRQQFGQKLRELRESQGISLEGLAHSTRISGAFIRALEEGEFQKLPGQVFGRGFVKSLAKTMGVSETEWANAYNEAFGGDLGLKGALHPSNLPGQEIGGQSQWKTKMGARKLLRDERDILSNLQKILQKFQARSLTSLLLLIAVVLFGFFAASKLLEPLRNEIGSLWNQPSQNDEVKGNPVKNSVLNMVQTEETSLWEENWQGLWGPHWSVSRDYVTYPRQAASFPLAQVDWVYPSGPLQQLSVRSKLDPLATDLDLSQAQKIKTDTRAEADSQINETSEASGEVTQHGQEGSLEVPEEVLKSEDSGESLEVFLNVTEPLKVKIGVDGELMKLRDLAVDRHVIAFKKQLDLLLYDASALTIQFNGRDLGPLGHKGRIRRLSFRGQGDLPEMKKKPE